eukprot:g38713.t1
MIATSNNSYKYSLPCQTKHIVPSTTMHTITPVKQDPLLDAWLSCCPLRCHAAATAAGALELSGPNPADASDPDATSCSSSRWTQLPTPWSWHSHVLTLRRSPEM